MGGGISFHYVIVDVNWLHGRQCTVADLTVHSLTEGDSCNSVEDPGHGLMLVNIIGKELEHAKKYIVSGDIHSVDVFPTPMLVVWETTRSQHLVRFTTTMNSMVFPLVLFTVGSGALKQSPEIVNISRNIVLFDSPMVFNDSETCKTLVRQNHATEQKNVLDC